MVVTIKASLIITSIMAKERLLGRMAHITKAIINLASSMVRAYCSKSQPWKVLTTDGSSMKETLLRMRKKAMERLSGLMEATSKAISRLMKDTAKERCTGTMAPLT